MNKSVFAFLFIAHISTVLVAAQGDGPLSVVAMSPQDLERIAATNGFKASEFWSSSGRQLINRENARIESQRIDLVERPHLGQGGWCSVDVVRLSSPDKCTGASCTAESMTVSRKSLASFSYTEKSCTTLNYPVDFFYAHSNVNIADLKQIKKQWSAIVDGRKCRSISEIFKTKEGGYSVMVNCGINDPDIMIRILEGKVVSSDSIHE
jgi:hypothetical protein